MLTYFHRFPFESIAVFAVLFPLAVMIYRKDYLHSVMKYMFWCLVFKLIIDLIMIYMASVRQNNLFLYNTYIAASYGFIAAMFYTAFDIKRDRMALLWISVIFYLVFVIDWYYVGVDRSVMVSATLQCLITIALTMVYFWELLKSLKIDNLLTYSFFWTCSGLLIYYASLTFITPLFNLVDRWSATSDFRILIVLAPVFECFYLFWMGVGFMKSKY